MYEYSKNQSVEKILREDQCPLTSRTRFRFPKCADKSSITRRFAAPRSGFSRTRTVSESRSSSITSSFLLSGTTVTLIYITDAYFLSYNRPMPVYITSYSRFYANGAVLLPAAGQTVRSNRSGARLHATRSQQQYAALLL